MATARKMTIEKTTVQENLEMDFDNIPQNVAIIMDGNRRWAKKNNLPETAGHWEGAYALKEMVKVAVKMGIRVLTVYAFSTENWSRSALEIESLMALFQSFLEEQKNDLITKRVRLCTIGDLSFLPPSLTQILQEVIEATKQGDKLDLVIAINYGGRDDITRAMRKIAQDVAQKKISQEIIDEQLISSYLDTAQWKDPDLLIRTSGEKRLSNFLLWQISYSEVVISDVLWPDFTAKHLKEAIAEYQSRKRRLGGT